MPVEVEHFLINSFRNHPEVPNLDHTVVRSSHYQMASYLIPITDIDILLMRLNPELSLLVAVSPHVNHLQSSIRRT